MAITKTKNNRTLGLSESTSDSLLAKSSYESPTIKVVAFQVELGHEVSPNTYVGDQLSNPVRNGIETFGQYQSSTDGSWAATDYNPYNEGRVF